MKIEVPIEHWDDFQEIFDGVLDNNAYLDLQTKLMDSIYLNEEDVLENRKDELKSKISEELNSKEIQAVTKATEKWINLFGCKEDLTFTIKAIIPLNSLQEWTEKYLQNILQENEEDLGYLEVLIENFNSNNLGKGDCLIGARYKTDYSGIGLIFESKVDLEKNCYFSFIVDDVEVAD
ncbi:MAG: hypothetical protein ACFFDT_10060, partial [Candidatus Hodarchaeota archaeon]